MNDRQVENLIDVLEDMTFAIKLGSIFAPKLFIFEYLSSLLK